MSISSRRCNRVGALLRVEVARLLLEEVSDPSLHGVSITEVHVSGDLKQAEIFFTSQGSSEKEVVRGFQRAAPFLKRRLGETLSLRFVPDMKFIVDTQMETVQRLLGLMDKNARGEG
ncbi:MAG: 30S ribosome-binding factor RbfA [Deltaproteobacteria bacterium]|nr:30S ribosome-binding factor RbfA [Deltaproteobacteria bacterium]